jgi:hypothetical protein
MVTLLMITIIVTWYVCYKFSMDFNFHGNLVINIKLQSIVVVDITMDLGICSTT